jgi:glycolate oxidase
MQQIEEFCTQHNAISITSSKDPAPRAKVWKARKTRALAPSGRSAQLLHPGRLRAARSMLRPGASSAWTKSATDSACRSTNVFHAGDGNVHPIFLYDDRDDAAGPERPAAAQKVLQYCIDVGER